MRGCAACQRACASGHQVALLDPAQCAVHAVCSGQRQHCARGGPSAGWQACAGEAQWCPGSGVYAIFPVCAAYAAVHWQVQLLTPMEGGGPTVVTVDVAEDSPLWELKLQLQVSTARPRHGSWWRTSSERCWLGANAPEALHLRWPSYTPQNCAGKDGCACWGAKAHA